MRGTRRLVGYGVFALSASLTSVCTMEAGLRGWDWFKAAREERSLPEMSKRLLVISRDPALLFEWNPNASSGSFTTNSFGMADDEVTAAKPPGVVRIAFLGDSITANFGHRPRPEIYANVLAEALRAEAGRPVVESLNFGVNAYSLLQILRVAQTRIAAFEPDLVVAQMCLNDPYPSNTPYWSFPERWPPRLYSLLFRLLSPAHFWADWYVARLYDAEGWRNIRHAIAGFGELARGGQRVLLVLFPYLYRPAYERWQFDALHAGYRDAAASADLPFLDLYASFAAEGLLSDRWPQDPLHPDAQGHRVAAREIRVELQRLGWLPPGSATR